MFEEPFNEHYKAIASAAADSPERKRALTAGIEWAEDVVRRLGDLIRAAIAEFRRRKVEEKRTVADDEVPHVLHEQVHLARICRIGGWASITAEFGIATWAMLTVFRLMGFALVIALVFAIIVAAFATFVIAAPTHAGITFLVKRWGNPEESRARVRKFFVLPAILFMFLAVLAYVAIQRLDAEDLLALAVVLSATKFVAMIGFVVLGSALLVVAELLDWSRSRAVHYEALCSERQRIASKGREWQDDLNKFAPVVLAAVLALASVSCATKAPTIKMEAAAGDRVTLTYVVDASGVPNTKAFQVAGQNLLVSVEGIVDQQHVTEFRTYWFGDNGWAAEEKVNLRFPARMIPVVEHRDAGDLGQVRPDLQQVVDKQDRQALAGANAQADVQYRNAIKKVMSGLTVVDIIPGPTIDSDCTDLNGTLARFMTPTSVTLQIVILATDGRQNCGGLDQIQPIAPSGKRVALVIVVVPNSELDGLADFKARMEHFAAAYPWAVIVPFYDEDLDEAVSEALKKANTLPVVAQK